jgi:hypothetical protein
MKKLLLYISLLFSPFLLSAQDDQPGPENQREQKIKALYVAYITQELKLTETEAQRFWPVHAQFDSEIKSLKHDAPELDRQQAVLNVKKKYQERFTGILGGSRTNDFFRKDGEFRKKMIDRLRQMKQQNMNRPPQMRRNNQRP